MRTKIDNFIKRRHLKYKKTPKPTTWSAMAAKTDMSWQHSWSPLPKKDGRRKKKRQVRGQQKQDKRKQIDKKQGKKNLSSKKETKRSLENQRKKLKPQMRNWVKSNNKPFQTTAATQAKSVKTEEGSKWSKRRTLWDRFEKRRRDGKKMKNFLNIARKRTRRQVLSCYMLNSTWPRKRRLSLPWRRDRDGIPAIGSKWSSNSKKNSNPMKRFQRKMSKIRRFIEERSTSNGETQRWKDLSKQTQKCIRDKKRAKKQEIQRILEDFKGIRNIPGIKSATRRVLITKMKNEKCEVISIRKGSCQCLWSLQKTIRWQRTRRKWTGTLREWDWKQHQWAKQRYEWDEKNSRDHDWRITDCNHRLKKTQRNQSRRHQSLRRRDERDGEANLQRVSKASWIYTRNKSRSENKSETQKVTLKMSETTADNAVQQIVSQTSPNPRGKSGEFRSPHPKTEHLATYKMIDQKMPRVEGKNVGCYNRHHESIRLHHSQMKFVTPLKSCGIEHEYIHFLRNCSMTRKPQYWQTKKVTCSI